MDRKSIQLAFCLLAFAMSAAGQTNTFPASGNVGIGTTSPTDLLSIVNPGSNSAMDITGLYGESIFFNTSYSGWDNWQVGTGWEGQPSFSIVDLTAGPPYGVPRLWITNSGNVGIGTQTPAAALAITNASTAQPFLQMTLNANTANSFGGIQWQGYPGIYPVPTAKIDSNVGLYGTLPYLSFYTSSTTASGGALAERMRITNTGNIGIGTTSPGATLEVDGNVKLTSGSGASIIFADGTVQSSAFTGVICGGDFAESVQVSGQRNKYTPGDVLVLTSSGNGDVSMSSQPYSTLVAGIYSTKPGYVGRRLTTPKSPDEIPMAMVGIVPTKVSSENGPIRRGDLLVTASLHGYAMKGTDPSRMIGAVVGKAMGSLDSGTGLIEVLVTLQ